MDKVSKLFLALSLATPFWVNAVESSIKVGSTFKELRAQFGMPENVNIISHSTGEKFEVVSFKAHQTVYVFDASVGSSMDMQENSKFKVCRIITEPKSGKNYMCKPN